MKNTLIILFLLSFSFSAYSFPKKKTLAEELNGTWHIKNVQKMSGLAIRTKKYTKDSGDPKAYINRFKGSIVTFNTDSTVVLVTANKKRTLEGRWNVVEDTKYRVKTGTGAPSTDHGHTESVTVLSLSFPSARSYNIEGEYQSHQFGVVKVKGHFAIVDPKYVFKFEKEQTDGDNESKED